MVHSLSERHIPTLSEKYREGDPQIDTLLRIKWVLSDWRSGYQANAVERPQKVRISTFELCAVIEVRG
jgi:hypothetical protein